MPTSELIRRPVRRLRLELDRRRALTSLKRIPALIVLNYHRVTPESNNPLHYATIDCHPDWFGAHLSWLSQRFEIVPVHDGVRRLRENELTNTSVAVTFDDGHVSVRDHAYPILSEYHVPATVFVCAGLMDAGDPGWFTKAHYLYKTGHEDCLRRLYRCDDSDLMRALLTRRDRRVIDTLDELNELFLSAGGADLPPYLLDRAYYRKEGGRLLDIGNHSYQHLIYAWLTFEEQLERIRMNHDALAEFPNRRDLFAVPQGTPADWNADTVRAALRLGLEFLSAHGGINRARHTGPEIRRISMDKATGRDFPATFYRRIMEI